MILELIFSSYAIFNLCLLTPMLGLSTQNLRRKVRNTSGGQKAP